MPYPTPTTEAATRVGKANVRRDTKPEVDLRRQLHRAGLRFRKEVYVRSGEVRVHVDILFTRRRIAVFVDGCFWHCCPQHFVAPKSNLAYWTPKLEANVARDRRVDAALGDDGWRVVRVWEHDVATGQALARVMAAGWPHGPRAR